MSRFTGTGPGACRTIWPQRGGNEQMHRRQTCAHSSGLNPARDISNRTNCVSRFESKSFLENILESNAGGRGVPLSGMAPASGSTCAHSSGLIRRTIYRTGPISYQGSNLSPFLRIFWNQIPGGGGTPSGWRQSAAQCQESDRHSLLCSCSVSRPCRVR